MSETIIEMGHIDPLEFLGVNNNKLNLIKKRFPLLKILARGSQIKLSGKPEEIEKAKAKIQLILDFIEAKGHLSPNYFMQILGSDDSFDSEKEIKSITEGKDILVFANHGRVIRAKTPNQRSLVELSNNNDICFAIGPAGTGKTYTAVALAVRALKNKTVSKIILTRPAVEAGESLGFLPGDLQEKIDPYLRPLFDALDDMIPTDKLNYYMMNRIIEVAPLAYMRGRTLDNAFIILDEAQNATDLQLKMFLTRIGKSAKAIITGDLTQVDLPKNQKSGLGKSINILKNIPGIGYLKLDATDVLRHPLVRKIIDAYEKEEEREENLRNKTTLQEKNQAQSRQGKTE